jgi:putative inorganic carbon (hco3(-)) transporter
MSHLLELTSTTLRYLIFITFIGLFVCLPSIHLNNQNTITYHDSQRLFELLLVTLVLLYSALNKTHLSNSSIINYAFLLLLGLALASAFLAKSTRHAMVEISIFAGLYYFSLFIAKLYESNKDKFLQGMLNIALASIVLYMISFYSGYITATIFKTPLHWPKPFAGFTNIRSFNQYQLWSLAIITLPLLAFDLKNHLRLWLYLALACWWVLLYYSASRGVLIAWLVGFSVTALIFQKFAWPLLRIQLINMTTGFIGYYCLFKLFPSLLESTVITSTVIRETTNDRLALWGNALYLISHHPYLGVGPMNYPWYNTTLSHPHNSVLQLASEWGLPATFIILAIFVNSIYCWLKKFNLNTLSKFSDLDQNLAVILFFTIMTNSAYSLVDGVIVMPISQVLMFTIIGLMIGFYNKNKTTPYRDSSINIFNYKSILPIITLIVLACSTWPEIKQALNNHEKRFSMGYTAAGPRIWWEIK